MKENVWINTKTSVEVGLNTGAGSPRAWLLRALDIGKGKDIAILPGSLHPQSIAVAGLWERDGAKLPDTGDRKTLFRFFDLPKGIQRGNANSKLIPFIGMAVEVQADEILMWIRAFKQSGAQWIWWAFPGQATYDDPKDLDERPRNKKLDHELLYKRFEQGETVNSLALEFKVDLSAISYVKKKWENGLPAKCVAQKLNEDVREAVIEDIRLGELSFTEIAIKHSTTRATVSKWAGRIGESRGGNNGKTKSNGTIG
jgi:hypothetical protein